MVPFSFAGETFEATPSGALFWPAREALLVADLHLEKASWFARLGQFLPPYDSHATLTALAAEVERSGATRLYCLGDSFHDAFGCDRLPANARELLTELTSQARLDLDRRQPRPRIRRPLRRPDRGRGRDRRDHPSPRSQSATTRARKSPGHFHPKLRLHLKGRQVSRRCFVMSANKIIMPAFGSLTGGLDAHHPEIIALGRHRRRGAGPRLRPSAALPARGLVRRLHLDRHRPRRD